MSFNHQQSGPGGRYHVMYYKLIKLFWPNNNTRVIQRWDRVSDKGSSRDVNICMSSLEFTMTGCNTLVSQESVLQCSNPPLFSVC